MSYPTLVKVVLICFILLLILTGASWLLTRGRGVGSSPDDLVAGDEAARQAILRFTPAEGADLDWRDDAGGPTAEERAVLETLDDYQAPPVTSAERGQVNEILNNFKAN